MWYETADGVERSHKTVTNLSYYIDRMERNFYAIYKIVFFHQYVDNRFTICYNISGYRCCEVAFFWCLLYEKCRKFSAFDPFGVSAERDTAWYVINL